MDLWIIWLIASVVFLMIELPTQMLWSACLAAGSLLAMAASLLGLGIGAQIAILAAASLLAYLCLMPLYRRWAEAHRRRGGRAAATGMDALLGRRAVVTDEIRPGGIGRARIDGDNWQVKAPGAADTVARGAEVTVTGYDSIILTVAPDAAPES